MVRTTRRRLLVAGGITALSGCTGDVLSNGDESTTTTGSSGTTTADGTRTTTTAAGGRFDDGLVESLAPVPKSVDGSLVGTLRLLSRSESPEVSAGVTGYTSTRSYADQVGLDPSQIDRVTLALYAEQTGLVVVTGSFAADEPTITDESLGDVATHRDDGRFVIAVRGNEEPTPWTVGMSAAVEAMDGDRAGVLASNTVRSLVGPVSDDSTVIVYPTFPPRATIGGGPTTPGEDAPESVTGVSFGSSVVAERTMEVTFVELFTDASAVEEQLASGLNERGYQIDPSALSYRQDGRRLIATGRRTFQPSPSPDASPDVSVRVEYVDGEVVIEHRGGDTVEASNLTVYVDGSVVEDPWSEERVTAGSTVTVAAEPFVPVRVEWTDPEDDDVFDYLARQLAVPRDAFESSYDATSDELTVTYTGSQPTPVENLSLKHDRNEARSPESQKRPLSEVTSALSPGDSFVVEDVQYKHTVALYAEYEWDNGTVGTSVMYHRVSPPGTFSITQTDGLEVVYYGEESNPAADYRVTVDDEPADTQFADQYTTLKVEDSVEVQAKPGQTVAVEWTGGSEPVVMDHERVEPPVSFELVRAGETYELTYTAETSWDAESLRIDGQDGSPLSTQFADSYTTLSKGDSVAVDLESGKAVGVVWTGGDEPMTVFREWPLQATEFELRFDDGTGTLTYTGSGTWPADSFRIDVGDATGAASFSGGSVTSGDSVSFEGSAGEHVVVRYTDGDTGPSVFDGQLHPELSFSFDYDAGADELTITLDSDASVPAEELSVLTSDGTGMTREKPFIDDYETVTKGDSVTLSVPSSLEAVQVRHSEWREAVGFQPE